MHALGVHADDRLRRLDYANRRPDRRDPKPTACRTCFSRCHGDIVFPITDKVRTNAVSGRNLAASGLVAAVAVPDTACMITYMRPLVFSLTMLFAGFSFQQVSSVRTAAAEYTRDGQLKLPDNYREWVYVSTGFDMSYNPTLDMGHHMFDNVFVNPEAYKTFVKTGTWPDKTIFVLEARGAVDKGSINEKGNYQSADLMGLEAHVKDES